MNYNIYSDRNGLTSPKIAKAFQKATGCKIFTDKVNRNGGWMGFGSPSNWSTLQHTIDAGNDFIYADHGYFGRGEFYKVTKNALFHSGKGKPSTNRLNRFYKRHRRWTKTGRNIVLCPQSDNFFILHGTTRQKWIDECTEEIRRYSDRPIIIHEKLDKTPLKAMLKDTWIVVSFTSNAGLEAVMHGVPTIATGATHYDLLKTKGFANIENPLYPDNRFDVAGVLADNQFTLNEIKEGKFLK